jgi:hypothetical protein
MRPRRKSTSSKHQYNTRRRYFNTEEESNPVSIHRILFDSDEELSDLDASELSDLDAIEFGDSDQRKSRSTRRSMSNYSLRNRRSTSEDRTSSDTYSESEQPRGFRISRAKNAKKLHFLSSEFDAVIQESGNEQTILQTQQPETQEVTDPEEVTERMDEDVENGNETQDHEPNDASEYSSKRKAHDSEASEFSDVVSESEDSELDEPIRSLRSTSQRNQHAQYSQHHRLKKRKLRRKDSVDYSKQLMPANFTQILDREFKELQGSSPKKKERQNKRLNESDDELQPTVFKNRIVALLSKSQHNKHTIVPQNMDDMLRAEEQRLLLHVSSDVRETFLKHRPEFKENSHVGFEMVAGFDEHIMALKEMVGLPLMYPELFSTFRIQPPKGVLFHGPPGNENLMKEQGKR